MNITTVGIVGAGTMGNGIAQACAVSGINAVMVDIAQAAVDKGLATVGKSLERLLQKDKISEAEKAAALCRIKGSTNYDDLKGSYFVIAAATENHALKNKILITGWQNFKVAGKYIFGSKDNRLYRYDIRTFRVDEWTMPGELYKSSAFNFTTSRLYALRNGLIEIYSFK